MTLYANWRDVPMDTWRWKNFHPREIACRRTGRVIINERALDKLQALRDKLGRPITITSGYRSPEHNEAVGGARNSKHMEGIAFDCRMDNHNPTEFMAAAQEVGFDAIGTYPKSGFIHIDDRGVHKRWGDQFVHSDTNLPMEPPRRPERLREDKDVQVVGGAGLIGLVTELATPAEKATGLVERLSSVSPVVLIVLAAAAFLVYRHLNSKPK